MAWTSISASPDLESDYYYVCSGELPRALVQKVVYRGCYPDAVRELLRRYQSSGWVKEDDYPSLVRLLLELISLGTSSLQPTPTNLPEGEECDPCDPRDALLAMLHPRELCDSPRLLDTLSPSLRDLILLLSEHGCRLDKLLAATETSCLQQMVTRALSLLSKAGIKGVLRRTVSGCSIYQFSLQSSELRTCVHHAILRREVSALRELLTVAPDDLTREVREELLRLGI